MRKPLMAGNWKMNKTIDEASNWRRPSAIRSPTPKRSTVSLCPPYVCLPAVSITVQGTSIAVGAQYALGESAPSPAKSAPP